MAASKALFLYPNVLEAKFAIAPYFTEEMHQLRKIAFPQLELFNSMVRPSNVKIKRR